MMALVLHIASTIEPAMAEPDMASRLSVVERIGTRFLLCLVGFMVLATPLEAQETGALDPIYDGVGLDQKLGASIPEDVFFTNPYGEQVSLQAYFEDDRPVILNLVYHSCPMLCNVLMDGFTRALKEMEWTPGEQFDIVTISIAPNESRQLAHSKKVHYVEELGRPEAAAGWHFLTGDQASISRVADAVGFRYKWVDEIEQFAHPAIITILTPEGVISSYLQGLNFEPRDIRLALVEASGGSIGAPIDLITLYCLRYDPQSNSYVAHAENLMRLGGFLTVLALGAMLFVFWRRENRVHAPEL